MAEAQLIDGEAVAAALRRRVASVAAQLQAERALRPGLAVIQVGENPASAVYVRSKGRACTAAGIVSFERRLPADCAPTALTVEIERLNSDERVDGILVQLPLPAHIDTQRVLDTVDPAKDVDGFHSLNIGRLWSAQAGLVPCTPQGCLLLLRTVHPDLAGAAAVVVGRSTIVGRPMAALLLAADCTVTIVHSKSLKAAAIARRADVLIAAAGRPNLIGADWVKPGAAVIDVGINPVTSPDGSRRIVGDVDYPQVRPIAGAITPVPGGVGPMTIACLLRNTVLAACRRRGLPDPAL